MKKSIALAFAVGTVLVAGCSSAHQAARWEYKQLPTQQADSYLNKLADEGWIVVCIGTSPNGAPFYLFKRPKQ